MEKKPRHMLDAIVGLQTTLTGYLDTDQSLSIHGVFEGGLKAAKTVFIDKEGVVSADIAAERVVVQGTVIGNIHARRVEIYTDGKVWGDVCAQALYVETGGFVRGQVIISRGSEPQFNSQSLQWLEDLDHVFVELEAVTQLSSSGDHSNDVLPYATIEQLVAEADIVWNVPSNSQATDGRLKADLNAACQHIEQLTVERDALQATVAQLTRDLDIAEQQNACMADRRDAVSVEPDEAQVAVAPFGAELEMSRMPVEQQEQAYTAYCLVCRAYRRIEGAREVTLPNGHRVVKGRCAVCGIRFLERLHAKQRSDDHG
jgi:cytoskeletal protein CcmA (bactofilin family)